MTYREWPSGKTVVRTDTVLIGAPIVALLGFSYFSMPFAGMFEGAGGQLPDLTRLTLHTSFPQTLGVICAAFYFMRRHPWAKDNPVRLSNLRLLSILTGYGGLVMCVIAMFLPTFSMAGGIGVVRVRGSGESLRKHQELVASLAVPRPHTAGVPTGVERSPAVSHEKAISPRKVIKKGELRFETKDARKERRRIRDLVSGSQGYIAQESQKNHPDRIESSVTVKVPVENFESLREEISAPVEKLDTNDMTADDVTEKYLDLNARIKTKKKIEERYTELLKKAGTIRDMLEVEQRIAGVRVDIEQLEGKLNYLSDRIRFSTLAVNYYQRIVKPAPPPSKGFQFLREFKEGLQSGWRGVMMVIIALAYLWPLIAAFALIIIVRTLYLRRRGRDTVALEARESENADRTAPTEEDPPRPD